MVSSVIIDGVRLDLKEKISPGKGGDPSVGDHREARAGGL